MKRKIIQLSTSTKVISLPSDWIRKNNLKKGTELEVTEKDNLLVVSRGENKSRKEKSIDLSFANDRDLIWMILDGLYMTGFDDITVKTGTQKQRDTLAEASKWFPGMIIYEEKGEIVRLKNISVQQEFDLSQIMSRIRNITLTIMDDCIDAIKEKKWEILSGIKNRDYTINMYVSLAFRHINKFGYSPMGMQGVISQHIKLLEIFSDRLCILFREIASKKNVSKNQMEIILSIRNIYRQEVVMISKFKIEKLVEFDSQRIQLKHVADKEEGKIGDELTELINIFREIEEIAVQLNM
jgi:phosphate uptake regulator